MNTLTKLTGLALVCLVFPISAEAATGTATGRIRHFNRMGNYCPTTRDCTGAKYPESQFNVDRPIRHVKVYVRDDAANIIGQGTTNTSGSFTITWNATPAPANIHITWHGEEKDGRFTVQNSGGGAWYFWTWTLPAAVSGTTAFGDLVWGASGAPHDITNIYDGAHRMWWDSLWWSSRQQSNFSGVRIYTGSTACPTSCADRDEVWLDPNAAYTPQARIMHELGHAASQRAHEGSGYWVMTDYCYPSTGSSCGWSFNTAEWRQPAQEEAMATFLADAGLYGANARQPHSCLSSAQMPCSSGFFNIESSSGLAASCAFEEDRWPLTLDRIYWDLFDDVADCVGATCDDVHASLDQMNNTLLAFPNGRSDGQKNEGWGCFIFEERGTCWPDNRDARNITDFVGHYLGVTGVSGAAVQAMNCN